MSGMSRNNWQGPLTVTGKLFRGHPNDVAWLHPPTCQVSRWCGLESCAGRVSPDRERTKNFNPRRTIVWTQ